MYQNVVQLCGSGSFAYQEQGSSRKAAPKYKGEKSTKKQTDMGGSMDIRPKSVEWREKFGHWEIDTVVGSKKEKEPCVLTITERKTRNSIWVKVHNHTADAIQSALKEVISGFGERANSVFRSITGAITSANKDRKDESDEKKLKYDRSCVEACA